jgi:hypothetical protein
MHHNDNMELRVFFTKGNPNASIGGIYDQVKGVVR